MLARLKRLLRPAHATVRPHATLPPADIAAIGALYAAGDMDNGHRLLGIALLCKVGAIGPAEAQALRGDAPRCPDWIAEQVDAVRTLERQGLLTAAEAGVLRNGERIADHYADLDAGDREHLDEVEALLRAGDLAEALIQLGRFRRQLALLPTLYTRSLARARA